MGLIPEDKIAEIRSRTDIVQVIGEYVTLRRAGNNHTGLCPFHQEKTPSFSVSPQRQVYYCFGCQESGDVFSFLMKMEGRAFVEVVRDLAARATVELPAADAATYRDRHADNERARLLRVNEIACNWFCAQLAAPVGERARAYLAGRGIGAPVTEKFRLGWAPPGWEALVRLLESKQVPHELGERTGLVRRRDEAKPAPGVPPCPATHYDVFVERVVYPLCSPMGEVLGFGGRVIDPEHQPKYKNSHETVLYKKGDNLFGLHLAKHAIRAGGRALLVEGNFDVIALHQSGLENAVAPQGTAITPAQVALLKRFAREVLLMLDADAAGRAATLKVVRLLVEAELPARIVPLAAAGGKKVDPDDLARNHPERLAQMIEGARDAVEFYCEQAASTREATVPAMVQAIGECVPLLREVRDPIARQLYVTKLAQLLGVDLGLVQQAMRGGQLRGRVLAPPPAAPAAPASEPTVPPRRLQPVHQTLLALLAQHPALLRELGAETLGAISDPQLQTLLRAALTTGGFRPPSVLRDCPAEIRNAVAEALLSTEFADSDPRRALADIRADLESPGDLKTLELERRAALAARDFDRAEAVTKRILRAGKHAATTIRPGETSR